MKLNYKRTVLVGLAFLSISAFWQVYDTLVPLMLKNSFGLGDGISGVVMAMDNVLALFMLPFFGVLSDKCKASLGKRMPFIAGGTAAAVVLTVLLPIADAHKVFWLFFITLGLLLFAMGTYRSPAVALMPDVTPKPLRSKGNAIINLMGALGGVYSLGMIQLLVFVGGDGRENYERVFWAVAALMAIAVIILLLTVKERKLAAEAAKYDTPSAPVGKGEGEKLPPEMKRSLVLILVSVSLWFMGYNAVTSAFSKYVQVVWGKGVGDASRCLMVATVGAVLSYLPVGMLSSRFGRKRMIQLGIIVLAACFGVSGLFTAFNAGLYVLFALVGAAWAMINVNSYPMVVEISKSGDVGKYTGYYYTFSMAAQIITPIISGFLLQYVGYWTLMPYAALMVALAFITITLTRHGDVKPEKPKSKLEAFDAGDD